MKKVIAITAVAIAATSYAQAQFVEGQLQLLAGNDLSSSFSDVVGDGPAFSTFTFQDGPGNLFPATQLGTSDITDAASLSLISDAGRVPNVNDAFTTGNAGLQADDLGFVSADGGFFEFSVDTSAENTALETYTDFIFSFGAGQTQGGASSVAVSYDIGGGFQSLGNTSISGSLLSGDGDQYLFDTTGLGLLSDSITFRVDFTDISAGAIFDNFQISGTGTVVPEPSTYAAIAGALALGFVAYRRRK